MGRVLAGFLVVFEELRMAIGEASACQKSRLSWPRQHIESRIRFCSTEQRLVAECKVKGVFFLCDSFVELDQSVSLEVSVHLCSR
jgi:hypothetical protein